MNRLPTIAALCCGSTPNFAPLRLLQMRNRMERDSTSANTRSCDQTGHCTPGSSRQRPPSDGLVMELCIVPCADVPQAR